MIDKHEVRIKLQLDRAQIIGLAGYAVRSGYLRENPNLAWSHKERLDAARWAIRRMIKVNVG